MTPSFVPIIGRDFSDIGGQTANWAQFNRGVDEANLSRLAAAQQTRNNWLQQIQQIQQQQADRQSQVDQQAQATDLSLAERAKQEAEARRQFDITSGIRRAAITAKTDALSKAQADATTQAENFGTTTADELADVATKMDRSLSEKTDAQAELAKTIAQQNARVPNTKVTLNRTGTMFVLRPNQQLSADEKSVVDAANSELADTYSTLKDAETQHADSSKTFAQLVKEASAYGLTARKKGDTWGLYHPQLNKWYLPKTKAAAQTTDTGEGFTMPPWASPGVAPSPFGNAPSSTTWPGFSDTTSGGAAPAQETPSRIGRYLVSVPAQ